MAKKSDNFYTLRKKMQASARNKEREYTESAVEGLGAPVRGFVNEASRAGEKISKGGRQIGTGIYDATQGNFGGAAKNIGAGMLNAAAGTANAAISPATGPLGAVTPDLGVINYLVENFGDNPKVQQLVQMAKENPMAAEAILNTLDLAGMKGAGNFVGKGLNAVMDNTPTKIPGFYDSPSPANKAVSMVKAAAPNFKYSVSQLFNPQSIADRRDFGTGKGRREEYVTAAKTDQNLARGNIQASEFIDTQQKRGLNPDQNTIVGNASEIQRYQSGRVDLSDKEGLRKGLNASGDIPDAVLDGAVNHIVNGPHNLNSKKGGTTIVFRKPDSGEGLSGEAKGKATTSASTLSALASQKRVNAAKAALGDADPKEFFTEFLTVAKHANPDNVRLAVRNGDLPDSFVSGSTVDKAGLQDTYWGAKLKLKKQEEWKAKDTGKAMPKRLQLTDKQQQTVDFFKKAPKIRLTEREGGVYSFTDSHKSSAQDLGGVNDWAAVDTKNGKVYTMISDGHDLFGQDPAGGNSLANVLPIQTFDIGAPVAKREGKRKRTATQDMDLSKMEQMTNMPRNKGESDTAYQARVMRDYKAKVKAGDYVKAGTNAAQAGMLVGQLPADEEKGP